MLLQEHVNIGAKTTMKIGGTARYYAELRTKRDAEEACDFAQEKHLPLIALGAGANTVFADGEIDAVIVKVLAGQVTIEPMIASSTEGRVTVEAGKALASLIGELASHDLDLSALTGIPGTVGGAIVGNAGQGAKGIWINSFVESVTVFFDGAWKIFPVEECDFRYRESIFKTLPNAIVWDVMLRIPCRPATEILANMQSLLEKRLTAQPHRMTAGSCFKAVHGTPAWQLIDAAGLKGLKVGGVQISEKHGNFLINADHGSFADLTKLLTTVRKKIPQLEGIEMRLYGEDGEIVEV